MAQDSFKEAFYALREQARKNGVQDMTLEEINDEIRQARAERAEKEKYCLLRSGSVERGCLFSDWQ